MKEYVEERAGGYYVIDTRVSLDAVVHQFKNGASAESIFTSFPLSGSLENVYGAITFYLANKNRVEVYLRDQERLADGLTKLQSDLPESLVKKLEQARQEVL